MRRIFAPDSPYTKQARFIAVLWTLLIFIGCFTPANELPKVDVPFIDKWTHLVLFGGFTFFWLCTYPRITFGWLIKLFLLATAMGAAIELLQGLLTFLGRSMEFLDAVADSLGALLGITLFSLIARLVNPR